MVKTISANDMRDKLLTQLQAPTDQEIEYLFYGSYFDEDGEYNEEPLDTKFEFVDKQLESETEGRPEYLLILKDIESGEFWGAKVYHDSWHEEPLQNVDVYPVKLYTVQVDMWSKKEDVK